jgi:glycosyltransferase involved in cell wall biosynthesis
VLQSARPDIEVMVVDDGSGDDTADRIGQLSDERLQYRFIESTGNANRARNVGAKLARSPLIAFLDSDDACRPGRVDRLIAFFSDRRDVDCLIDGYIERSRGRTSVHRMPQSDPDRRALRYMLLAHMIPLTNSAITIRRAAFEAIGGYDESMPRHQDRELLLRLGLQHSIWLGDGIDVEKHRSSNSISHEFDGYIDGLSALAERVPDFFLPENQRLFSYLIVRGILKAIATGHWRAAKREICRLRRADKLPKGFIRNLIGYREGRWQRHRYRSRS